MDLRKSNGGVFLGLNGIVVKSHGGTDAEGFAAAIDSATTWSATGCSTKIEADLDQFHATAPRDRSPSRRADRRRNEADSDPISRSRRAARPAQRIMTNADFEDGRNHRRVDRAAHRHPPAPYRRRRARRRASLGEAAARAALANAGLDAADIDLIVLATSTPDNTFPATAVEIQAGLGMHHGFAFDMQAVCSGFVYALTTADLSSGRQAKRVLVIGAETFSRILDWTDRSTCVLFGDGAGAVVLEAQPRRGHDRRPRRAGRRLRSDGAHKDKLYVDGGPSTTGTVGHLRMEGREVFKHAVGMIADVIEETFAAAGITAPTISTGSCRTRPTSASSTRRRRSSASPRRRWSPRSICTATPRLPPMPLALSRRGRGRADQEGRSGAAGSDGRRLHLGRGAGALVET